VPAITVAGRISLSQAETRAAGFTAAYALADLEPDPARSITHAAEFLGRVGACIADEHLPGGHRPARPAPARRPDDPALSARKEAP
jgi:hypothetical protein